MIGEGSGSGSKSVEPRKLVQIANARKTVVWILGRIFEFFLEQIAMLIVISQDVAVFAKADIEAHVPILILACEQPRLE
tara:strand:+ start:1665 stop:1901 length:237 start_codon:yes stop_codon:yes gene_type:complete